MMCSKAGGGLTVDRHMSLKAGTTVMQTNIVWGRIVAEHESIDACIFSDSGLEVPYYLTVYFRGLHSTGHESVSDIKTKKKNQKR